MTGVITASDPAWIPPFSGLSPRHFGKLITALRCEGADPVRRGRPWSLPLEDRVLLVAATGVPTSPCANWHCCSGCPSPPPTASSTTSGAVGRPLPGNRNDCKAWELPGAKAAVGRTTVIADGGCRGTGLLIALRRAPGQAGLPAWKEERNRSHRKIRARIEHAFARMKTWKILRDCRLDGDRVHHAMLGIARLHNLTLAE
ncbi:hypothetical protein RKD33_007860 [Streptomyces sp. SAI-129]